MKDTFKPGNVAQLRDAISWAADSAAALELIGSGSKRRLGKPVQAEHGLSLAALDGILFYEPEELVLSAAAGTPLAGIEQVLASNNQMLAFEPPDYGALLGGPAGQATLGGVIAANLSGSRRFKAGAARDHLLGFAGVNGSGEIIKSGGRVMKNVSGYDLCKLMAGSYGTLAALSELTIKVVPAPEVTSCLVLDGVEMPQAVKAMTMAAGSACDISGAAWLPEALAARSSLLDGQGPALLLRLEGFAPSVSARLKSLHTLLAAFGTGRVLEGESALALWRQISHVRLLNAGQGRSLWRISLPPMSGADVAAALQAMTDSELMLDQVGGVIWLAVNEGGNTEAEFIRNTLKSCGGHATLISASAAVRASVPVFQPQPQPLRALSRRVKHSFDPLRILNPGRLYGGM